MAKTSTHTHTVNCSVCFAKHFLNPGNTGLNPIRHGFMVVGGDHGAGRPGSWHTGPCAGVGFPHFGHSTEGTIWALGEIKLKIEFTEKHIAGLEARPDLSWSHQPTKYQGATWQVRKSSYVPDGPAIERTLKPGTESERIAYRNTDATYDQHVIAPSYEQELAKRLKEANTTLQSLQRSRDQYQAAIDGWKPAAPVKAPGKVVIVHKMFERKDGRKLVSCNPRLYGNMTAVDSEVTCQRCKKSL